MELENLTCCKFLNSSLIVNNRYKLFSTEQYINIATTMTNASYILVNNLEHNLGYNCIQNYHLGRYIIGYRVGNLVLWQLASRAVKRDIGTYIRQYTSTNENFVYGYTHYNGLLQSCLKLERNKPHKGVCHPTKCDIFNEVKLFPSV